MDAPRPSYMVINSSDILDVSHSEENEFVYGNDVFRQIQGTAMGSPAAVVYADIVMLYLEKRYVLPILEGEGFEVQVYRRFIIAWLRRSSSAHFR